MKGLEGHSVFFVSFFGTEATQTIDCTERRNRLQKYALFFPLSFAKPQNGDIGGVW